MPHPAIYIFLCRHGYKQGDAACQEKNITPCPNGGKYIMQQTWKSPSRHAASCNIAPSPKTISLHPIAAKKDGKKGEP